MKYTRHCKLCGKYLEKSASTQNDIVGSPHIELHDDLCTDCHARSGAELGTLLKWQSPHVLPQDEHHSDSSLIGCVLVDHHRYWTPVAYKDGRWVCDYGDGYAEIPGNLLFWAEVRLPEVRADNGKPYESLTLHVCSHIGCNNPAHKIYGRTWMCRFHGEACGYCVYCCEREEKCTCNNWGTAQEAAKILGVSKSSIIKMCSENKFGEQQKQINGSGGLQYRINLNALRKG